MATKISSVSYTKVKELVSPSPQLPLSIGFLLKPPFELRRAAGGLWSVPIKSAAGRLFELRSKRYSPWTVFPPLCVLLNLLKPLNDSEAEVHEIHHVSMSPDLLLRRFYDISIWWTEDGFHGSFLSLVGEECTGLDTDLFY